MNNSVPFPADRPLDQAILALFARMQTHRRTLHAWPELAFEEERTAAYITRELQRIGGWRIQTGVAKTGVIAERSGAGDRLRVYRADMDALPIAEETGLPFASERAGVMHACGHDLHTSILLGLAELIATSEFTIDGTIRLLFQPAEEFLGGATPMIEAGALDPLPTGKSVESVLGLHIRPDLPCGTIGLRSGPFMASADHVDIRVWGGGGHAAAPHESSCDAIVASAQIISVLQTVVSRNVAPYDAAVVSIGKIAGGAAANVLPAFVDLAGTIRTTNAHVRKQVHDRLIALVTAQATALGGRADVTIKTGYDALVNDPDVTERLRHTALDLYGPEHVITPEIWMAAEDFAHYGAVSPSCFAVVGCASPDVPHSDAPLHTSVINPDERTMLHGLRLLAHHVL